MNVYLALSPNKRNRALLLDGPRAVDPQDPPAVLVSYVYVKPFLADRSKWRIRSWLLDSGAFSAWNSGATVDLDAYIDTCKELLSTDPALDGVIALDVVGDWRAGRKNLERMWSAGVSAWPVFHIGEPEDLLMAYARDYPKLCVGGVADLRGDARRRFAQQVFARVWPKKIHGLAIGNKADVLSVPWDSVDASSWETSAARFGRWKSFGNARLRAHGSDQDLRREVAWYRDLERLARHRWSREMSLLDAPHETHDIPARNSRGVRSPVST